MKFIVAAPKYNPLSAGCRALYDLNQSLNQNGYQSEIMLYTEPPRPYDSNAVVIYPEVIPENPLNATKVVRYMLNKDGLITGKPIRFGANDFILTWFDCLHNPYHARLWKPLIPDFFNDHATRSALDRNIDCTYIGKGAGITDCKVIPNTIYVNGLSRKALADLLRQTRILYTYDPLSVLNSEAMFCGAMVCILNYKPFDPRDIDNLWPSIKVHDNKLIMALDYQEQREKHISTLKSTVKNYNNTLNAVVEKIKQHFNL